MRSRKKRQEHLRQKKGLWIFYLLLKEERRKKSGCQCEELEKRYENLRQEEDYSYFINYCFPFKHTISRMVNIYIHTYNCTHYLAFLDEKILWFWRTEQDIYDRHLWTFMSDCRLLALYHSHSR